jgi:geranylgeranyl diphosphate synthase type II
LLSSKIHPDKHQKMQTLHQIQSAFEKYLRELSFGSDPDNLYRPVRYILSLGGKRLRPVVLLLCHKLYDDDISPAMPAAAAIEVFHNFTLVHDDIMDEAPLRRGKPTVHHKFDTNKAILSGDVMLVLAYDYLLQLENQTLIPTVSRIFTKTAIEVCEGQQMDMDFEERTNVSVEEYLRMIELKTSVLVAAAMKIGALTGGASDADAQKLYEFGRNLGIAFQLQDDLLDTFGDPEKFGKQPGGDIIQNKKTYLILKALELAGDHTRAELLEWYSNTDFDEEEKIAGVKSIFTRLDIPAQTKRLQTEFERKAMEQLNGLDAPSEKIEWLKAFAEGLMKREF